MAGGPDRRRQVGWIARDVGGRRDSGGARAGHDLNASLHAGFAMARRRAIIEEFAGLGRSERDRAASALADDAARARPILIDDDVVLGAFAVN